MIELTCNWYWCAGRSDADEALWDSYLYDHTTVEYAEDGVAILATAVSRTIDEAMLAHPTARGLLDDAAYLAQYQQDRLASGLFLVSYDLWHTAEDASGSLWQLREKVSK